MNVCMYACMYIYPRLYIYVYICINICIYICIYIYIHIYTSSSSSCRAVGTDIPNPLSPLLPIVHHFRQVFRATPSILT